MESDQQKYIQLQVLEQQLTQIQNNLQMLEQQLSEIEAIKASITEFEGLKKDSEVLMPIANGIFANAKLQDNSELLVNVGSGIVVKKSIKETIELMDNQGKEIEKYRVQMAEQMQKVIGMIETLQLGLDKE